MREDLDRTEKAACEIARRVLGVEIEPWDVHGRQNAVDALLHYPDGRVAAFEVSKLAADGAIQLDSLLGREDFSWPLPGRWWWTVTVDDVSDLPRARAAFQPVVLWCEENGVTQPHDLRLSDLLPPDVFWVASADTIRMTGHPDVPARDGDKVRSAQVMPGGVGGGTDRTLGGLREVLTTALSTTHLRDRVAKLRSASEVSVVERHLFVPIHLTAFPFRIVDALIVGTSLPPTPPPLPPGLTHLWLAPSFGRRVLLGTAEGWAQHYPYDED